MVSDGLFHVKPTISIAHDLAFTARVGASEQTVFADHNALHAGIQITDLDFVAQFFQRSRFIRCSGFFLDLILAAAIEHIRQ